MRNKMKAWRKSPKAKEGYSNRVAKRHYVQLPVGIPSLLWGMFERVGLINDKKETA